MIEIHYATPLDIPSWMECVREVRANFPGLETEEGLLAYEQTLAKNIGRRSAICAKLEDKIVGVLLFSVKHNMLSCMAVLPAYRRQGIAERMIEEMFGQLDTRRDIAVSTFRQEDEKGAAPRALYRKFGFVEAELTEEFGYPHQTFVLRAKRADAVNV